MKLLKYLLFILYVNILGIICATIDEYTLCSTMPTVSFNINCEHVNDTFMCYENIPADLPPNVKRVQLHCIDPMEITNETFQGGGWDNVTYLMLFMNGQSSTTLHGRLFTGMKHLTTLHINIVSLETLDKGVFDGLENLTTLNLDNCVKLNFNDLLDIMSNEDVLPNLHVLSLRKTSYYNYIVTLGERFWKMFKRPVTFLDISEMKVTGYDLRILDIDESFGRSLEHVNVSGISVSHGLSNYVSHTRVMQNLKTVDLSGIYKHDTGIKSIIFCSPLSRSISNIRDLRSTISSNGWTKLGENIDTLYLDHVCGDDEKLSPFIFQNIKNVSYVYEKGHSYSANLKRVYFRKNNIRVFDAEVRYYNLSSLVFIDLTGNGLEYIHPVIFQNFPFLANLVLSDNNLGRMQLTNETDFVGLFRSLHYLEQIKLDNNRLNAIPPLTFAGNTRLTSLDLESNMITDVSFLLKDMPTLTQLNLRNNRIKIVQSSTIDWLTNFPSVKVTIGGNVLTCQKCSDYSSVQSLLKGHPLIADFDELRCEARKDVPVKLSSDVLKSLTFDCHRTAIIGATVASTVAVVTTVCIGITVLRYKRKIKRRENRMASAVANLNHGNGFAVYLIYSSVDEVFVRSAVFSPLNEKLKQVTGVERDLVCIGDEQFRVGWNIYREMYRCMERSNVAVVVLSEGFANSVFCDQEIDIAMQLKKPVILLLKGDIDINQHSELIQLLFRTNVRILFGYEDNELILKTTWDKVCESFLQMS